MEQTYSVHILGTGDNENSAGLSYRKVNPERGEGYLRSLLWARFIYAVSPKPVVGLCAP